MSGGGGDQPGGAHGTQGRQSDSYFEKMALSMSSGRSSMDAVIRGDFIMVCFPRG
eukprot:COSAG01_NODE_2392_length_7773_cov_9.347928_8_plen_55_part_00